MKSEFLFVPPSISQSGMALISGRFRKMLCLDCKYDKSFFILSKEMKCHMRKPTLRTTEANFMNLCLLNLKLGFL